MIRLSLVKAPKVEDVEEIIPQEDLGDDIKLALFFNSRKNKGNYSEPYCPKIMSGVPSKAAFNALTAFMPFFLAVPM